MCKGYGKALSIETAQMITIDRRARDALHAFCNFIGWQIAIYRSTVNPVIVSTEEYDVISMTKAFITQNASPNLHGYASQMEYTSGGRAVTDKIYHFHMKFRKQNEDL